MPRNPADNEEFADDNTGPRREAFVEFKQVGQAVKVTAVDAATGIEVVIMGPVSASQNDLKRVAVRKLKAQLKKNETPSEDISEPEGGTDEPDTGGWIA